MHGIPGSDARSADTAAAVADASGPIAAGAAAGSRSGSIASRLLARLSRVTAGGAVVAEIDGLRLIAIGSVLLFHLAVDLAIKAPASFAPPPSGSLIAAIALQGFRGVELFFVISGFILALPFASWRLSDGAPVQLGRYYLRRLTRLEPPYLLCMVLLFAAAVLLKGRRADDLLPHLGASLLYLHNLAYGAESAINNVAWSLEIEVQFYLAVPLLAAVFAVRRRGLRRGLLAGTAALWAALAHLLVTPAHPRAYWSILRFLHLFLLGFLLADVYLEDWGRRPSRSWRWDVLSLAGWPALFLAWDLGAVPTGGVSGGWSALAAAVLCPFAVLVLYVAAFRGRITSTLITNPWVTAIGGMCYSIYLWHNPLLGALLGVTAALAPTGVYALDLLGQAVLAIPLVLLGSALYFVAIEKPCMRKNWVTRLGRWLRGEVPPASA